MGVYIIYDGCEGYLCRSGGFAPGSYACGGWGIHGSTPISTTHLATGYTNLYFILFKSFTVQSTDGTLVSCTSGQNYAYMNAMLVSRYKD